MFRLYSAIFRPHIYQYISSTRVAGNIRVYLLLCDDLCGQVGRNCNVRHRMAVYTCVPVFVFTYTVGFIVFKMS